MRQETEEIKQEIASVTLDARPKARPASEVASQIPADPNAALANVAGGWLFESDLAGNLGRLQMHVAIGTSDRPDAAIEC